MPQELSTPNEIQAAMTRVEGGVATLADIISVFGLPGSALSFGARWLAEKRLKEAREVLLSAFEKRRIAMDDVVASDGDLAAVHRFFRAAEEGVVHRNVKLLAETVASLKYKDILTEDAFNAYFPILRNLTYEQVVVAGRFHFFLKREMEGTRDLAEANKKAWDSTKAELVPSVITTKEDVDAISAQLVGLGLFYTKSGWGNIVYEASPILERIIDDTSFNEIAEGSNQID